MKYKINLNILITILVVFAAGSVFAQTIIDWKGITWDVLNGTATVDGSGNLVLTTDGTHAAQVHVNRITVLEGVATPWIQLSYMDVTTSGHKIDMTMDDEGGLNPRFAVGSLWSAGEVVAMRRQSLPTYETYLFFEDTRQDIERTVYVGKRASGTLDVNFDGKKRSSTYLNQFVGGTWEYKDVYLRLRAAASGETVTFTDFTYGTNHANQTPTDFLVTQDDQGTVMSIQKSVDESAAGDVINVAAGTYIENINIDKVVTVSGEDRNTTIINGTANLTTGGTLEHFTVGTATQGAFISGNGATIDDSYIRTSGIGASVHSIQIYPGSGAADVTITNSTIETQTPGKAAIYVETFAILDGLLLEGNTLIGDYGITQSFGALNTTIRGNTFTGIAGSTNRAIQIKTPMDNILVENNEISGFGGGLRFSTGTFAPGLGAGPVVINNNDIHDNGYGLLLADGPAPTVTNNPFNNNAVHVRDEIGATDACRPVGRRQHL